MSLESQIKRLEQRAGVVEDCPLCASRAEKVHDGRDAGLRVTWSQTIQTRCPQCGSPFNIEVVVVERADREAA